MKSKRCIIYTNESIHDNRFFHRLLLHMNQRRHFLFKIRFEPSSDQL